MLFNSKALLAATFISAATASPRVFRANGTACAAVASQVANASALSTPTVAAQLAYDCIKSVPLNTPNALELLRTIRPYLIWQSTTAYLKDPPAEYTEKIRPPVDIFGGLDKIESDLRGGSFKTEYDFGFALYTLLQSTHDGHVSYVPDTVGRVFQWGRPVPLVSVSEDGEKLPAIFVYADILAASQYGTFQPSPLTKINGQDAVAFMENWIEIGSLQDRDALWNNAFYNLATVSLGSSGTGTGTFSGGGRGRWIYPGATTDLAFANGSTASYTNYARVMMPLDGVASGEDLARKYFAYNTSTFDLRNPPVPTTTATPSPTSIPAPGYPTPIVRETENAIGGYYLDEEEYADVAVLSVPSFDGTINFQQVGKYFLGKAVADGKKKLVIDVSANGGGIILQGYDLFKQLFPLIDPYAAGDRFRAHESFDLIGQFASNISGFYPRSLNLSDQNILDLESLPLNYRSDLNPTTNAHFTSWPDKYGPETHHGDNFTKLFKWWLDDPLTTWNSGGIEVTGYGIPATPQPFNASNIVIVYDGYCASTCTIFSELMQRLAGVQTIAMGGRPNDNIIQAVGGTKGTNNFSWSYIQSLVEAVYNYSSPDQQARYDNTSLVTYNSNLPFARAVGSTSVNARDGIRKNDTTNTPLQFRYEEADCRLFFTPEMTVDVTAVWRAAVDVKWGKEECVAGLLKAAGTNITKRAARGSTETATVGPLDEGRIERLMASLNLETGTQSKPWANGLMLP
ncbi:hypothetical protein FKW77_004139 [Venturia effusa]|uniref:CPAF-like PDZ domain-containing protein n=1 Tax=Venturia effusa TaxID=50376 RepID=A0A517LMN8_9PEZI|nr:hypothetical protein FKW77_004139 [Venturia effusa]